MNTYEVSFRWNGRAWKEQITTTNSIKARQLILGRYEGAVITGVREV